MTDDDEPDDDSQTARQQSGFMFRNQEVMAPPVALRVEDSPHPLSTCWTRVSKSSDLQGFTLSFVLIYSTVAFLARHVAVHEPSRQVP